MDLLDKLVSYEFTNRTNNIGGYNLRKACNFENRKCFYKYKQYSPLDHILFQIIWNIRLLLRPSSRDSPYITP
jgi:hypothetical protein